MTIRTRLLWLSNGYKVWCSYCQLLMAIQTVPLAVLTPKYTLGGPTQATHKLGGGDWGASAGRPQEGGCGLHKTKGLVLSKTLYSHFKVFPLFEYVCFQGRYLHWNYYCSKAISLLKQHAKSLSCSTFTFWTRGHCSFHAVPSELHSWTPIGI